MNLKKSLIYEESSITANTKINAVLISTLSSGKAAAWARNKRIKRLGL